METAAFGWPSSLSSTVLARAVARSDRLPFRAGLVTLRVYRSRADGDDEGFGASRLLNILAPNSRLGKENARKRIFLGLASSSSGSNIESSCDH